ncbi:hypothetical protein CG477_022490 (plasmid) [Bacillus cytotoxicus]|uniref:hypothetical protein n=1 Tax=Bacillus cereus group TaxID=86661 RepID=UPI000B96564B|nr:MULTISPECIES: hypothetical protein [Bacillus cereus group]AWC30912.1 hypothetical protein CG483_022090 [Bacillus cytotoxicus]AWC39020.1 hypothetical protein CG481_022230 [Bacillus cytotoxicus]AWC55079.1 hypothetical protein CG477_022490 [Bacillus cytotoxicus]AWC59200.1 hypothetical protein CG476_022480 [Bacillus cytotoxicus]AWC63199.1 hypothetical protein CG474_021820 [Bacillus cytotoxicus]
MLLKNFLLSKAKRELSPQLDRISTKPGNINKAVKKILKEIDSILLEEQGFTTEDISLQTPRKYKGLETILSYLVHEGFSCVKQDVIAQKAGISKPLINETLSWLEKLGICQQIRNRKAGKKGPSVYILTIHNNYQKIIDYFKHKWHLAIEITETISNLIFKWTLLKEKKEEVTDEQVDTDPKQEEANEQSEEPKDYFARKEDFNEYLSKDQQRAWHYIMSSPFTNLSEKDAYAIANRMPPDIDRDAWYFFRQAADRFEASKADKSNAAYFIEIFSQNYKSYLKRKKEEAEKYVSSLSKPKQKLIIYDFIKGE